MIFSSRYVMLKISPLPLKKYANALKNYTDFNKFTLEQLQDEADNDEDN